MNDQSSMSPLVSVVMPIYGVERFVADAIDSVLSQSFTDFEFLIVDDVSPDNSRNICESYTDERIRIITHAKNRGLAGARNSGIRQAKGKYIALLDSDDKWTVDKLKKHVEHLNNSPEVGVSFSRSVFMNEDGVNMNTYQMPKLSGITPEYLLCRNPIGNGSAPVIRREVFDDIAYQARLYDDVELFYFDDKFRQSEDIECWIRIAATTDWKIEGLTDALTVYRLNSSSLSANIPKQLATWEAVIEKATEHSPELIERAGGLARAYQLRYLARQAIRLQDGKTALSYVCKSIKQAPSILWREPSRTFMTLGTALLQRMTPKVFYRTLEPVAIRLLGSTQRLRIAMSRS